MDEVKARENACNTGLGWFDYQDRMNRIYWMAFGRQGTLP